MLVSSVGAVPWQGDGSSTATGDASGSEGAGRGLSAGRAAARPRGARSGGGGSQVCCKGGSRTPELGTAAAGVCSAGYHEGMRCQENIFSAGLREN